MKDKEYRIRLTLRASLVDDGKDANLVSDGALVGTVEVVDHVGRPYFYAVLDVCEKEIFIPSLKGIKISVPDKRWIEYYDD